MESIYKRFPESDFDLDSIRIHERKKVLKMDNETPQEYILNSQWIREWRAFLDGGVRPGKIDNYKIERRRDNFSYVDCWGGRGALMTGSGRPSDYRLVNINVWEYFMKIYGGGPTMVVNTSKSTQGFGTFPKKITMIRKHVVDLYNEPGFTDLSMHMIREKIGMRNIFCVFGEKSLESVEDRRLVREIVKGIMCTTMNKDEEISELKNKILYYQKELIKGKDEIHTLNKIQKELGRKELGRKNEEIYNLKKEHSELSETVFDRIQQELGQKNEKIKNLKTSKIEWIGVALKLKFIHDEIKKIKALRDGHAEWVEPMVEDISMPDVSIRIKEMFIPTSQTDNTYWTDEY